MVSFPMFARVTPALVPLSPAEALFVPFFSVAYALFPRSFAILRTSSPLFSIVSALLQKTTGVYPLHHLQRFTVLRQRWYSLSPGLCGWVFGEPYVF